MNVQNHVVVVASSSGRVWVLGTNTQRGFTEAGAKRVVEKLMGKLPDTFTIFSTELEPINGILARTPPRVV